MEYFGAYIEHLLGDKRDGAARSAGPCCTAHTVYIVLRVGRNIQVNHTIYVRYIQTSANINQVLNHNLHGVYPDLCKYKSGIKSLVICEYLGQHKIGIK